MPEQEVSHPPGRPPSWISFHITGPPTNHICWSLLQLKIWLESIQ